MRASFAKPTVWHVGLGRVNIRTFVVNVVISNSKAQKQTKKNLCEKKRTSRTYIRADVISPFRFHPANAAIISNTCRRCQIIVETD